MNCKQNDRINQVKESTLVVGIDIGSTTQYARAFDWRGIELGKVFKFSNSREGFDSFKNWMQWLQGKYKKSDVIVGIEPTGHYWFDLGAYLEDGGILLVMVNPYAVKQTKELDNIISLFNPDLINAERLRELWASQPDDDKVYKRDILDSGMRFK